MNAVKKAMMQQLVKILAPTSPAYGNGSNLPFIKQESLPEIIDQLQIGDIIFTKTNSSIYQVGRLFMQTQYDHVSVVINKNQVIHISPPIISKIDITKIVQKSRQPLIFRINFESNCDELSAKERKDMFLIILHHFLGEQYNQTAIPTMFKNQFAHRFQKIMIGMLSMDEKSQKPKYEFNSQVLKYSKICSEAILYALFKAHPTFCDNIEAYVNNETKYKFIGFIMPEQFKNFLEAKQTEIVYNGYRKKKQDKTLVDNLKIVKQALPIQLEKLPSNLYESIKKVATFTSTEAVNYKKYLPAFKNVILLMLRVKSVSHPAYYLLYLVELLSNNQEQKKVTQILKLLMKLVIPKSPTIYKSIKPKL